MAEEAGVDFFNRDSEEFQRKSNQFTEFLRRKRELDENVFANMLSEGNTRYIVRIDDPDLADFFNEPMRDITMRPLGYIAAFEDALTRFLRLNERAVTDGVTYSVGFDGAFGKNRVSPRDLDARRLCQLVCVEGIATKVGSLRPNAHETIYSCDATGRTHRYTYHDYASFTGRPTTVYFPTKDSNNNPLSAEFGKSKFEDRQSLAIQEMPERAPPGLLPCSVDAILSRDLVDKCKPGDRVQVFGVYRPIVSNTSANETGYFRAILVATHVKSLSRQAQLSSVLTDADIQKIRDFHNAHGRNPIDILTRSVAPSIFGHHDIKRAILLMLLGGVEKNLDNGTHIRGDINVLLCGDPSTAKSQLLRFVLHIAPLALNTTGRGSSGVGLTAAVTTDRETGERRLEAGAMVLADRGIVCIDEFDKMSDNDRVAIHEVMEQQTVTIAKAGLHMTLNARCSVLAAANPVYGRYDPKRTITANVGLQDSLLSRFDLLFTVEDHADPARDRAIARRVLSNHRYRSSGEDEDAMIAVENSMEDSRTSRSTSETFVKFDRDLHSSISGITVKNGYIVNMVTTAFLKKYIRYARESCAEATLDEDAADFVQECFGELRDEGARAAGGALGSHRDALPVTARALETLVRLAAAHAKVRLSTVIGREDCVVAYRLVHATVLAKASADEEQGNDDDGNDSNQGNADAENNSTGRRAGSRGNGAGIAENANNQAGDGDANEDEMKEASPRTAVSTSSTSASSSAAAAAAATTASSASVSGGSSRAKRTRPSAEEDRNAPGADQSNASSAGAQQNTSSSDGASAGARSEGTAPTQQRIHAFSTFLRRALQKQAPGVGTPVIEVTAVVNQFARTVNVPEFSADEIDRILNILAEQNKVMYRDGSVIRM